MTLRVKTAEMCVVVQFWVAKCIFVSPNARKCAEVRKLVAQNITHRNRSRGRKVCRPTAVKLLRKPSENPLKSHIFLFFQDFGFQVGRITPHAQFGFRFSGAVSPHQFSKTMVPSSPPELRICVRGDLDMEISMVGHSGPGGPSFD